MEKLKGLVLSGGAGTRLRPITHTSAKQLVPVANKPVLFYGLEALRDAGIREVGIIVGDTRAEIEAAVGDGSALGLDITIIPQSAPLGLAHAVLTAEEFLGDSSFVMYLGDNLLRDGISALVDEFRANSPDAMILVTPVDEPEHYGVAQLDADGRVLRLVEKPKEPVSNLALVGVYMFTPAILDSAKAIEPSWRNELEITDAIQHMVDRGLRVDPHEVTGWWKDTGQVGDMLEANRLILDVQTTRIDGDLDDASSVEGRVVVEQGARLIRSTVRGPAVIGADSVIEDAYIGPYSAVSSDCTVVRAEIEHSILLEGSTVRDLDARVESSLIGRGVTISRTDEKPRAYRFVLGDSSTIGLV